MCTHVHHIHLSIAELPQQIVYFTDNLWIDVLQLEMFGVIRFTRDDIIVPVHQLTLADMNLNSHVLFCVRSTLNGIRQNDTRLAATVFELPAAEIALGKRHQLIICVEYGYSYDVRSAHNGNTEYCHFLRRRRSEFERKLSSFFVVFCDK